MRVYRRAISYFKQDTVRIMLLGGLVALSNLLNVLWPLAMAILIDVVLVPTHNRYWPYEMFEKYGPSDGSMRVVALAVAVLILRLASEVTRMVYTLVNI